MTSATQISANQANSQLSSGPRTDAGKAASSLNNLRLGFRSQTVLLPGDDPSEYQALLHELTAHFAPEDVGEERFVREMADAEWRLRRVRQHMQLAITRRIATLSERYPDTEPFSDQDPAQASAVRDRQVELQSRAIETLSETGCSYGTWLRYERKFENQYDRAYKDWTRCQDRRRSASDRDANRMMKAALTPAAPGLASSVHPSVPSRDREGAVAQIARNAPCPCGSGGKFKRCCGKNAPAVLGKAA